MALKYAAQKLEFYGHEAIAVDVWNVGGLQPPAVMSKPERTVGDFSMAEEWAAVHIPGHKTGDPIINELADLVAKARTEG